MENFLTPPTDNLWKFIAISGLWGVIFLIVLYGALSLVAAAIERDAKLQSSISDLREDLEKIRRREIAIEGGRLNDDRIEAIPSSQSISVEKELLANLLNERKESLRLKESIPKDSVLIYFQIFAEAKLQWIIYVGGVLACFTLFGFSRWWKYVQVPSQRRMAIELQLLEIELKEKQK